MTFCGCPGNNVDVGVGSGWHLHHATICSFMEVVVSNGMSSSSGAIGGCAGVMKGSRRPVVRVNELFSRFGGKGRVLTSVSTEREQFALGNTMCNRWFLVHIEK